MREPTAPTAPTAPTCPTPPSKARLEAAASMPHLFQNRTSLARAGRRPGPEAPTRGGGGTGAGWGRLRSRVGPRGRGLKRASSCRPQARRALQVGWPQARLGARPTAPYGRQSSVWLLADTGPGPVGRPPPGAAFTPEEPLAPRQELGQTGIPPTRKTAERGATRPAAPVLRVLVGLQRSKRCGGTASAQHRTDTHRGQRGDVRWWGRGVAVLCKLRLAVNA